MNHKRGEQFHDGDNGHRRQQEPSDYRESEQWGASNLGAPGGSGYAANRSLSSRRDFGREGSADSNSGQRLYGGRSSYMDDDYGYPERGGIDSRPPASYPGYNSPEQGYGNDETGAATARERDAEDKRYSSAHHMRRRPYNRDVDTEGWNTTHTEAVDYTGKGPADYVRSDERIREDACDRLTYDPHLDASGISVAVEKGEITLSGTVNSRQDKRRAEDCVELVAGNRHVQNNLRVASSSEVKAPSG